ncbi:PocR ligand-binding domain-containing protein [Paenibacillus sp. ACRRX]|uniref:PocR ligand-binding domain-containing protein n=1 Tax=unclassified Paenibacillus TaxID=185978 RepID=UPI001EF71A49|nr:MULTISPECIES: PocR ligand-binding domain-containing protein [unclassified Paenibacillus]MCG7406500.1 PocR ligand-binding domain-containing protein [Paenibacillus sp. ACRRX]MDK8179532.1 PocR ligand-binding domain-containing protein [Paenibacillus sp. UMB4589-SE434]
MSSHFHLDNIIDMEKWQKLQDSLSLVTKMAIITTDYKGVPVTGHSHCQSFCQAVRKDETLSQYCQKCDARGGLEAVRLNKPYIYLCHFSIVDIAIPIIVNNQYMGAIMAGQVKLQNNPTELEQIVTRPSNADSHHKFLSLEQEYSSLPVLTYEEVNTISEMLYHLCNYIVEEAVLKNSTIEMYRHTLVNDSPAADALAGHSYRSMVTIKNELEHTLIDSQIGQMSLNKKKSTNVMLQPAFDYMYTHKNENVKLTDMAALCHVSASYFSRMFTKETGENFSVFMPRLKMEWAKHILESTDLPISQISNELGFSEPSYFIKTFKRFERITPSRYRQVYKR